MVYSRDLPAPPTDRSGWPWTVAPPDVPSSGLQLPRISIVTPSYNQGRFLEATIRSVLLQGYPNLEYFVIDGGSQDESLAVLQKYGAWLTEWRTEPDRGQADAINKGLALCTGEILGWVNSDDLLWPGHLLHMGALFAEDEAADLVYRDVALGPEPDRIIEVHRGRPTSFREMVSTGDIPIPQQSSLWRRTLFNDVGPLNPKLHVLLDRDLFLRAAEHGTIRYAPGIGGFFRQHPQSKSSAEIAAWERELPPYYQRFFAHRRSQQEIWALRRQGTSQIYLTCFVIARRLHRPFRAAYWLARAATLDPLMIARRLLSRVLRQLATKSQIRQSHPAQPGPESAIEGEPRTASRT